MESIQEREALLQEMEAVSQMTAREGKQEQEARMRQAEELGSQVGKNFSVLSGTS